MNLFLIITLLVSGLCSLSYSVPQQYHVVKESKSWTEAQQYCREKFIDLVTIYDKTETEKLKSLIQEVGVSNAWIGLNKGNSSKWEWSDGSSSTFLQWYPGEPNYEESENCTQIQIINAVPGWVNEMCTNLAPFLCYTVHKELKRQVVRVKFSMDSQVNINDAAVQQAFLQQIQQKLMDEGMPADALNLTWKKQLDDKIFHKGN